MAFPPNDNGHGPSSISLSNNHHILKHNTMSARLSEYDDDFSLDEEDEGEDEQSPSATSTTDTTTIAVAEKPCAWSGCYVGGKLMGCQFPGLPPNDMCNVLACFNKFHHGCQTEWENAQQLHAFPDDDPTDNKFETGHGSKSCMRHHFCFAVAAPAEKAAVDSKLELKRKRESDTSKKKIDLVTFAERQTLDNIVLTKDGKDVETLGGVAWSKLLKDAKKAFIVKNKIQIPQAMRNAAMLGAVVANWLNSTDYRAAIVSVTKKNGGSKKQAAATKPACLLADGTMYRVVNTIISCKKAYMETKANNDREDQDSQKPKQVAWDIMTTYYNDDSNEDLNELSPDGKDDLVGLSVDADIPSDFDRALTSGEFKELVLYLNAHYRTACNSKTTSTGKNSGFSAHCGAKPWLIYYRALLLSNDHQDLGCFGFPVLPEAAVRTSSSQITPMRKNTNMRSTPSTSTSRSLYGVQNAPRAETVASATISAMNAMSSRMDGLIESEAFNLTCKQKAEMTSMRTKKASHDTDYLELKEAYRVAKAGGKKNQIALVKERRNQAKKMARYYKNEYEKLKELVGYESDECSSASSGSDDDE